jgi:tetratricopeptide (TPR) repeat protein
MTKIALLIGVSEFNSDELAPLPKSSTDLEAMKEVLIDPELGGFAESDITVLKNPNKQIMEDAIYDLFSKNKRKKDDLLLFYFSGHGITDERGIFYFSNRETRKENGRLRPTTAISSHSIHTWMNECPSRAMATILDCCYSGAFAKGMSAKGTANALIKEQLGGEGRAILTAASATEYAWAGDELDLSAYTYYLLEGVRTGKASIDNDNWLSMEELHEYARQRISDAKLEMTPEFYPVREGAKIRLFKVKITAKEQYRKELQPYLKRGRIPDYARDRLENLREKLQISQDEAQLIEREVFAPLQQKQENLKRYEKALRGALNEEGSLDSNAREELKRYQQQLELQDEDIKAIAPQMGVVIKRPKVPAISVPFLKNPKLLIGAAVGLTSIFLVNILQPEPDVESVPTPSPTVSSVPETSTSNAYLGIEMLDLNSDVKKKVNEDSNFGIKINDEEGVLITEVHSNTPAAAAGMKKGDVIVKIDGIEATSTDRILQIIESKAVGDTLRLHIKRNGQNLTGRVEVGQITSEIIFLKKGNAKFDKGDYQGAIDCYNQAIDLNPYYADAYNNRGNAHFKLKNYQQALSDYDQAISLNSEHALAYNNRGLAYRNLNKLQANANYKKQAIDNFQKAAELYQKQGKTQDYQNALERVKKLQ